MRVNPQTLQPSSRSESTAALRQSVAAAQPPSASPVLALQARLQDAFAEPTIELPLAVGRQAAIILLLATASWGLVGCLILAIVR